MRCTRCGDPIHGKPSWSETTHRGGWCGSRRRTTTVNLCEDCHAAGEYQQHLLREQYRAELEADIARRGRVPMEQGELF
ncbi:MAG TPA: hypothetical protein VFB50_05430 [Chloroflexota bacterium]|nr:hypothetical protein [Chloroflexota bacterium]